RRLSPTSSPARAMLEEFRRTGHPGPAFERRSLRESRRSRRHSSDNSPESAQRPPTKWRNKIQDNGRYRARGCRCDHPALPPTSAENQRDARHGGRVRHMSFSDRRRRQRSDTGALGAPYEEIRLAACSSPKFLQLESGVRGRSPLAVRNDAASGDLRLWPSLKIALHMLAPPRGGNFYFI